MFIRPIRQFLLLFCAFFSVICGAAESFEIAKIEVEGLTKSDPELVIREFDFQPPGTLTKLQIERGISRIKNTRLLNDVSYRIQKIGQKNILVIQAKDKWTTIPILKFSSGGGVNQFILGVFDPNILGSFLEGGTQIERLGETNSYVAWFKNPRLFGERLKFSFQYWDISRLRTKYDQQAIDIKPIKGFLHQRQKIFSELEKSIYDDWSLGLFLDYHNDSFSDEIVPEEVKEIMGGGTIDLPPATVFWHLGLKIKFGGLNYDSYLVDGWQLGYTIVNTFDEDLKKQQFESDELHLEYFKTLGLASTFGLRFLAGSTTTDSLQYWHYLGGLDRIRGFADNRFAGRHYWLANIEFRTASLHFKDLVLQNVFFHDVLGIGDRLSELENARAASVGFGLRFIVPKIYRFVARLDYAETVLRRDEKAISFGVQQFF